MNYVIYSQTMNNYNQTKWKLLYNKYTKIIDGKNNNKIN